MSRASFMSAIAGHLTCTSTLCRNSNDLGQRANVWVQVEEVIRVVFGLNFLKPAVIGAVCGRHRISDLIVAQIIHVPTRPHKGLHLGVSSSRPGDARLGRTRVHPFGEHEQVVTLGSMRKSGVADPYPGDLSVHMLQEKLS